MKILYFHQYFSTPHGAGGTRSYEMARRLVARGHQVTMVCGDSLRKDTGLTGSFKRGRREGEVDGFYVIQLALSYSNHDSFLKRSITFLRFALHSIAISLTRDYDLIFATSTPLTAGIPGIFARWLRGKPFVFEVRDLWPELPREMGVITNPVVLWAMGALEWLSYRSAHGCIGLSPGIVKGITRRGVKSEHVTMIPNGCDLALFGKAEPSATELPGVSEEDFLAIFTGTHGIANGLDVVLDAAGELKRRRRSDIKLLFIGDGKLKPRLQDRARQEELANVLFLDPVPKHQLARLLARVDAGLMILANVPAFYYGTSPNKFFDYIAAGLPVINNYPGWLAELIGQHGCGIAVPPECPEAFADALEQLADHPDECRTMSQKARHLAETEFARDTLGESFVTFLETTAARLQQETGSKVPS